MDYTPTDYSNVNRNLSIFTFACSSLNLIVMTTTLYMVYRLENNHKADIEKSVATIEQINDDWPDIQTLLLLVRDNLPAITSVINQFSSVESFVEKLNAYLPR